MQAAGAAATSGLLWLIGGIAAYAAVLPAVTLATFAANRSWTFRPVCNRRGRARGSLAGARTQCRRWGSNPHAPKGTGF